ncbi:MAG: permease-like cell division protein FtsX [Oscillospiraceae bacterium]|jgi:cell division transport system permease protein|nr:permease-like cell division protein FtsX [Oscillospiraceae bacterium]
MRFNSIIYLTREGLKSIWNNWIMSLASTIVLVCCLFLTGSVILLSMSVNKTIGAIESKNTVTIHLNSSVSSEESEKIGKRIKEIPNIASCEFYSKEQAIQKYSQALGDLMEGLKGDDNPLPDAFHISMTDLSKYNETIRMLSELEGVESIGDRRDVAKRLTEINNIIHYVEIGVILIFALVALFIVSNTVRLTMYGRRLEISIMKSVGATNLFIRIPFIVEGVTIGLFSSFVAIALLKLLSNVILKVLQRLVPFTSIVFDGINLNMTLFFLLAGISSGFIGGVISIRKYLRKEGGKIIAL